MEVRKNMVRTILIALFLVIFSIISLPLYFLVFIIGKFDLRKKAAVSQKIVACALKIIIFLAGVKLEVEGVENIPADKAVLYVANHRGYFDIITTYATVPTLTGYISKDDIKKIPCVSNWMKRLNCLFLERENVRQGMEVILKAIENVKNGYSIFVMPEGTRNHTEEVGPFKNATFKIAQKTGCPVVPVAIMGSDDIFENCSPKVKAGTIKLKYGKPVYLEDIPKEKRKQPGEIFREIVVGMLEEMK